MDKIIEKLEVTIEKQLADLEVNPIKTGFRLLLYYWIAKTIWRNIR